MRSSRKGPGRIGSLTAPSTDRFFRPLSGRGFFLHPLVLRTMPPRSGRPAGDTHEKNLPMQRVFQKNGFLRCGLIRVEDGTERIAFQKTYRP